MEYQAISFLYLGNRPVMKFESGWWSDKEKARAEVNGMVTAALPAGCYKVGSAIRERKQQ